MTFQIKANTRYSRFLKRLSGSSHSNLPYLVLEKERFLYIFSEWVKNHKADFDNIFPWWQLRSGIHKPVQTNWQNFWLPKWIPWREPLAIAAARLSASGLSQRYIWISVSVSRHGRVLSLFYYPGIEHTRVFISTTRSNSSSFIRGWGVSFELAAQPTWTRYIATPPCLMKCCDLLEGSTHFIPRFEHQLRLELELPCLYVRI